ncbi:TetR/AcrR family transcriptional regulator [Nesterenkonia pannonica]|uniref:helix-turn-helix domain-containing protein n=1 Tax=Nesterenkonia pannonica TaxID=1548602 RepID=UPI002164D915|nr:helix-turn-helix domain-containing protein [Nesterenkonia pannonica]
MNREGGGHGKEIASKAGVGTATLYRHFENKDTLIDEVSIVRWMQMEQTARQGAQMGVRASKTSYEPWTSSRG